MPKTNGKAERVIRTLMVMWHDKYEFCDSVHREQELKRLIHFYNTIKPHTGFKGLMPFEVLESYFYPLLSTQCVNDAAIFNRL